MPIFYIIDLFSFLVLILIGFRIIRPNGFKRQALFLSGGIILVTFLVYGGAIIGVIPLAVLNANIHYLVFAAVMTCGLLAALIR